jgi:hypothetical protein
LWELVCDRPLHPGPSEAEVFQQAFFNAQPHPDEVKRGLPRAVVDVLLGAVAREKARRFPDAAALAAALSPLAGVDVHARLAARVQRHFDRLPRSRAELEGGVAVGRAAPGKPAVLPAPPGEVKKFGDRPEDTEPVKTTELLERARAQGLFSTESPSGQTLPMESRPTDSGIVRTQLAEMPAETTMATPGTLPVSVVKEVPREPSRRGQRSLALVGAGGAVLLFGGFFTARAWVPPAPSVVEIPLSKKDWKSVPGDEAELPLPAPPADVGTALAEPPRLKVQPSALRPPKKGGKGKIRFITSEPAEVFVGKKRYGLTNEPITLPSGRHHVEVVVPGGEKSAAIEVDVVAGTSSDLKVTLER